MKKVVRAALLLGALLSLTLAAARAQDDKGEMVENPMYKFWASFKPGATATVKEVTKFHGEDKDTVPGGTDRKEIVYRLASVNEKRVIVATIVHEDTLLGSVESAPTRITYPAKIKKEYLETVLEEFGAKHADDETVKVGDKQIKCKVLKGSFTKKAATTDFKLCYSDAVPGGIVQRMRTTKLNDKPVAETTITVVSYNTEPPKKGKEKGKEQQ